jgi:PAS domain S-box-containing protein
MNDEERALRQELEERLRFEELMAELSARFISLRADQVDGQIEQAQRVLCEALQVDRCTLLQREDHVPEIQRRTHLYQSPGLEACWVQSPLSPEAATDNGSDLGDADAPRVFERIDLKASFPWCYQQLRNGQTVVVRDVAKLPPEAGVDQLRLVRYGAKSAVAVPMRVDGDWIGCLILAALLHPREWPARVVKRLEFIADVFASALARKRADVTLRQSEARFRMVADSAPVLIWMSGVDKLCTFFNRPWLEFTGRTLAQELGNGWAEGVHAEDVQQCWNSYAAAFDARQPFALQYRLRRNDGEYRWISDTGVPRYDEQGHFAGYIGSCVDFTDRKLAEEALHRTFAEIRELKERLQAESDYLKAEMRLSQTHGEILGQSEAIKAVLRQVEQSASADCSVLINGETGTGKELVAQEIHRLSRRREKLLVLVNCAALPSALVESELFGRERGAYTGALTSQVGRFEVADGSTIFLDEVGELSLEAQGKLLRVLEAGEFERLGSSKPRKVDVRVIAATNRDLAQEVRAGRFREDLYYRLRVFPIKVPPLRERVQDIPVLAFAFLEEFAVRMGKQITRIPRKAMESLQSHSWPGNVRELRNVIEHSVILTFGDVLRLSFLSESPTREAQPSKTLAEAERDLITRTLENTGWRIKGRRGAAERLDLKPSTLYSRMQKLGIPHRRQKDEMPSMG